MSSPERRCCGANLLLVHPEVIPTEVHAQSGGLSHGRVPGRCDEDFLKVISGYPNVSLTGLPLNRCFFCIGIMAGICQRLGMELVRLYQ